MAGYSGTPLSQKIGIKPGHRVIVRNHPATFLKDLGPMPEGAQDTTALSGKANVVVCFTYPRQRPATVQHCRNTRSKRQREEGVRS